MVEDAKPTVPMKILVVDNRTQRIGQLKRMLSSHRTEVVKAFDLRPHHLTDHDMVVLSGGSVAKAATPSPTFKHQIQMIREAQVPIFGICLGMQVISHAFDGKIVRLDPRRRGTLPVRIDIDHPLVQGHEAITVYESHKWAVTDAGPALEVLGRSEDGIEIIRHREKPIVGVQFHPEADVEFDTSGRLVFDNFVSMIA